MLCSDINSYPVARAVTASSAVPVLFNPVVLENYAGCDGDKLKFLADARKRLADNVELEQVVQGLETFAQKEKRKYAHLVDGGITDNLGLRAIYEIVEVGGGVATFLKSVSGRSPRHLVFVSVDASTDPVSKMGKSNKRPSIRETINAVTSTQLHRYNAATIELIEETLPRWAEELSTSEHKVQSHFIQVDFKDIDKPDLLAFFNLIPTSFDLSYEQVDKLIEAGRRLIRENEDFKRLIAYAKESTK